jgi:hypothetical protein
MRRPIDTPAAYALLANLTAADAATVLHVAQGLKESRWRRRFYPGWQGPTDAQLFTPAQRRAAPRAQRAALASGVG